MKLDTNEYTAFLNNLYEKINANNEVLYSDYFEILTYRHDFNYNEKNSMVDKCNERINNLSVRKKYCKFDKKNPSQ